MTEPAKMLVKSVNTYACKNATSNSRHVINSSSAIAGKNAPAPAAMCICGVPFAVSYFVNAGVVKPFELLWFFRYGFFTEMMRGRFIYSAPMFWTIWYALLLFGVLVIAIIKRKERKEL